MSYYRFGRSWPAAVLLVVLGALVVSPGARGETFEQVAGSAPILEAAVESAAASEELGYTQTAVSGAGGLHAEQDSVLTARPEVGAWGFGPRPVSVATPSAFSPWGSMDFGAAGVVRWRLEQRGVPVAASVHPSGQALALRSGVELADGRLAQHVAVAGAGMVEEFVIAPDGATSHELSYTFELPAGWRLEQSGDEAWVVDSAGDRAMRVRAPLAQDEAAAVFGARIEVLGALRVAVEVSPAAMVSSVGDVTIDPIFSASGVVGELSRKICAADATGCVGATTTLPSGFTSASGSDYTLSGNAGSSNWGVHLAATAGNTFSNLEAGWIRYTPPANLALDAWIVDMRMDNANMRFECRGEGHVSGTAPSEVGAWFSTNASDFASNVNPASAMAWAGVRIRHYGATDWTSGSTTNNKCSLSNETRNKLRADLLDATAPTQVNPGSINEGASGSSISFNDPNFWTSGSTYRRMPWDASDVGSGIYRLRAGINVGTGNEWLAPSYANVCDPASADRQLEQIPCPLDPVATNSLVQVTADRTVEGANTFHWAAYDYSGRGAFSGGATFYYDSVAPNAPGSMSPASGTHGANGLATLTWAAASDTGASSSPATGSGVASYLVCVSQVATACNTASNFTAATTSPSLGVAVVGGTWYWQVKAIDRAGNTGSASTQASFTVDATAPSVALTAPTGDTSLRSGGVASATATASDASGIASVRFEQRVQGTDGWSTVSTDSSSPYAATYSPSADGLSQLRAVATDSAGSPGNTRTTSAVWVCRDTATLDQPTGAKHRFVTGGAEVWWTAASGADTDSVGYIVERRATSPVGSWTVVSRVPASITSIVNPTSGTDWEYRVSSIGQLCTTQPDGTNGSISTADAAGQAPGSSSSAARIGREAHWTSRDTPLGATGTSSVNLAGGNNAVSFVLVSNPGRGLSTNVTLTYNSQDLNHGSSLLATGGILSDRWTLGLDGLSSGETLSGMSLDPIAVGTDSLAIRDADGTPLTFTRRSTGSSAFDAPAGTFGVILAQTDADGITGTAYVLTLPDRTRMYWAANSGTTDADGRLLAVRDRNGNRLSIRYECIGVSTELVVDEPGARGDSCATYTAPPAYVERYRPWKISDAAAHDVSPAANRDVVFEYWNDSGSTANRDGHLKNLVDHAGTVTRLDYTRTGSQTSVTPLLSTMTEAYGVSGIARSTTLTYDLMDIPLTSYVDESTNLTAVTDPRSNLTSFSYAALDDEELPRVRTVVDRSDNAANDGAHVRYNYAVSNGQLTGETRITNELDNTWNYSWVTGSGSYHGRVTRTVEPGATGMRTRNDLTVNTGTNSITTQRHEVQAEDEAVTLTGTTAVNLAVTPIAATTQVVVRSGPNQTGTVYTSSDYTLTRSPTAKIVRTVGSTITSASTVYVTYIHATWVSVSDLRTGYALSGAEPITDSTPTEGELEPATTTTYTNTTYPGASALNSYVGDIATTTTPRGTATTGDANDFQTTTTYQCWQIASDQSSATVLGSGSCSSYTAASGTFLTDRPWQTSSPINTATGDTVDLSTTEADWNADGTVKSEKNGRGYTTGYTAYDANGIALKTHERTSAAFDPATTPVDTQLLVDAAGRTTCTDDRRETSANGTREVASSTTACVNAAAVVGPLQVAPNQVFEQTFYDALGQAVTQTTSWDGTKRRATTFTYNANGIESSRTENVGYTPSQSAPLNPSTAGAVTAVSGLAGGTTSTTRTKNDLELTTTLPSNGSSTARVSEKDYDAADQLVEDTQPEGVNSATAHDWATRNQYDATGRQIATLDGENRLNCTYYDAYGNAIKTTLPMEVATDVTTCKEYASATDYDAIKTYDRNHQVATQINEQERSTTYAYDLDGNQITVTDPLENTTTTSYDPGGNALTVTAPARDVCAANSVPDASSCSSTISYSPVTQTRYDANGNVYRETSARATENGATGGHYNEYAYDADDRKTRTTFPRSISSDPTRYTHTQYDTLGRISATSLSTAQAAFTNVPARYTTSWTYNPDGNIANKTDQTTDTAVSWAYDVSGEVKFRTEHAQTTVYTYNSDGSMATEDTPVDGAESYTYNANGDQLSHSEAGAGSLDHLDYDKSGAPLEVTNFDGSRNRYTYDRNGNITTRTEGSSAGSRTTTYTYGGPGTAANLLVSTGIGQEGVDPQLSADFTYDAASRLATVVRHSSPTTTTTYSYDPGGATTQIRTVKNTTGTPVMQDYDYWHDLAGNIRKESQQLRLDDQSLSSALTTLYTYDSQDRVLTDDQPDLPAREYQFDDAGRIDKIVADVCSGGSNTLEEYTYEDDTSPASTDDPLQIETIARNSVNIGDITACASASAGTENLTYTNGAVTEIASTTSPDRVLSYDALNRQTEVRSTDNAGTTTEQIGYDALDRRASETIGSNTTTLRYAGSSHESTGDSEGDVDTRGSIEDPYGNILGEVRHPNTDNRYILTDLLGSTVAAMDSAGTVEGTFDYDTYGAEGGSLSSDPAYEAATDAEVDGTAEQFTGQRVDDVAETTHHQAREYSGDLRVWMATDQYDDPTADQALALDIDMVRTSYAAANPTKYTDPTGHDSTTEFSRLREGDWVGQWCVLHFSACRDVESTRANAITTSSNAFVPGISNYKNKVNTYRHAYWQVSMVSKLWGMSAYGKADAIRIARAIGDLHEKDNLENSGDNSLENEGCVGSPNFRACMRNQVKESVLDQHNNVVGRSLAFSPSMSTDTRKRAVANAWFAGRLQFVYRSPCGACVWSVRRTRPRDWYN